MIRTYLIRLAGIALLAGCATPYQEQDLGAGYSEVQLDSDMFRVSFIGKGYTEDQIAADYAMLRSAELTLEQGFNYFVILQSESTTTEEVYRDASISSSTGNVTTGSVFGGTNEITETSRSGTYAIDRPTTTQVIVCFEDYPENMNNPVYDAAVLSASIREAYGMEPFRLE